jgi:hypothetical protein
LRQVLLWYHQEKITIPVARARKAGRPTVWLLPNYQHLLRMLKRLLGVHHPFGRA